LFIIFEGGKAGWFGCAVAGDGWAGLMMASLREAFSGGPGGLQRFGVAGRAAQKKARLRQARRLLIVPFKTKIFLYINMLGDRPTRPQCREKLLPL